jgi:hypothetical protein
MYEFIVTFAFEGIEDIDWIALKLHLQNTGVEHATADDDHEAKLFDIDTAVQLIQWLQGVNIAFTLSVQVDDNF